MTIANDAGLRQVLDSLAREAGGGVPKAVNVTLFFDATGRSIGMSFPDVTPLKPRSVAEVIRAADDESVDALARAMRR